MVVLFLSQNRKETRKMKKIIAMILAIVMMMSLAACGDNATTGVEDGVLTVGME